MPPFSGCQGGFCAEGGLAADLAPSRVPPRQGRTRYKMTDVVAVGAVDKAIAELINFDLVLVENSNAGPSTYVNRHRHAN